VEHMFVEKLFNFEDSISRKDILPNISSDFLLSFRKEHFYIKKYGNLWGV